MRMPCQRPVLHKQLDHLSIGRPFEHEANCCLSADAIQDKIVRFLFQGSTQFPHSLIHCRIMSKNDRLLASLSRSLRTQKVMPTLPDWKPEANDIIIPCVSISNPLVSSLILNQFNGPNRCRKKHSKSFMLRQPFPLRIYGSSSSISSQERR